MAADTAASGGGAQNEPARGGSLKQGTLPTHEFATWQEFEAFTERVLSAHRFCPEDVVRVVRVERWGRPGDKQDGIDFEGEFSDGDRATWQCKHYKRLTVKQVQKAVADCVFPADRHYLVFSGEASPSVRKEIDKHDKWQLLDSRGLARLVEDMPLYKRREVLDATWGVQRRRLLLETLGEDAFLGLAVVAGDRRDKKRILNDLAQRVGRDHEMDLLRAAVQEAGDLGLALVSGPGGRGKTRLLVEVLEKIHESHPSLPVLWLARGRAVDQFALAELPLTPAVIVLEDVHEDHASLAPLFAYAARVPGTCMVLSSRPRGVAPVKALAVRHDIPVSLMRQIPLEELPLAQARAIVRELTSGLGLTFAVREYLAQQATHSPYVAVIAANLIRRGELKAPPALDAGFRGEILGRYLDQATQSVDGLDDRAVSRLLAVHAALGSIPEDVDLMKRMANFAGIDWHDLVDVFKTMEDRGVMVTRGGYTRVVPDILADHILEKAAARGRHDTRFVGELWAAFGADFPDRLVTTLAELGWRLAHMDGPPVFIQVWHCVQLQARTLEVQDLPSFLRRLSTVASTQPHLMIDLLDELRERATAAHVADRLVPSPDETGGLPTGPRATARRPATGPLQVLQQLAPHYGACAMAAPELLERSLDALWALRCMDDRQPHQHPDHPDRVLADELANLRDLPDASFPGRIVKPVRMWLEQARPPENVATPLFALKPLLAKNGTDFVTKDERTLVGRAYFVAPEPIRSVRDDIRDLLRELGTGNDLRLAGEAVALLGGAIRQVIAYFGAAVEPGRIVTWEDDDLASIAVLKEIAGRTNCRSIRRLIREKVSWLAYRAESLPLQHAALSLLTELDNRPEDDLAEIVLHAWGTYDPSRRGLAVPSLSKLELDRKAQRQKLATQSQSERDAERQQDLRASVEHMRQENEQRSKEVVADLVTKYQPDELVHILDDAVAEAKAVKGDSVPGVAPLFWGIADVAPRFAGPMTTAIAEAQRTSLDSALHLLVQTWLIHDPQGARTWLTAFDEQRTAVRGAVATAFLQSGLADDDAYSAVQAAGLADPDLKVRNTFLVALHRRLASRAASTVDLLIEQGITIPGAVDAIAMASNHDASDWGSGLDAADAAAALRLADHASWDEWSVQQLVSGIATRHTTLVMDHLLGLYGTQRHLPHDVNGLPGAVAQNAHAFAQWVLDHSGEAEGASAVVELTAGSGLTGEQADELEALVHNLTHTGLAGLAQTLRNVTSWPATHPTLARTILARSRTADSTTYQAVLKAVGSALIPRTYGWCGETSPELERAKDSLDAALTDESDEDLRQLFAQVIPYVDRLCEEIRVDDDQD